MEITGYTDSTGDVKFNERLSRQRAEKATKYMALLGIDKSKMSVIGKGEADPVADNATAKGRSANRRTVVKVITSSS